jgi:Transposase DDE domain
VLSACRDRLLANHAAALVLDTLLERCRALGWLTARGPQRTDSTHVLAAIRVLNRLELVAETLRATLNALATVAPDWLCGLAPLEWYDRSSKHIEDTRLPKEETKRQAYAQMVGEDGCHLLDAVEAPEAPAAIRELSILATLRRTWQRHDERTPGTAAADGTPSAYRVRFKTNQALPRAAEGLASPYDTDARYRNKRDTQGTGYMVHVSETCEPAAPHLLTHVHTTPATVHEAQCTAPIQQALVDKDMPPRDHLVDAAYIDAELLVESQDAHGIILRGPPRPSPGWQAQVEGAYTIAQFQVDWDRQVVICPQGKCSATWAAQVDRQRDRAGIIVAFRPQDCAACVARPLCTRAEYTGRRRHLPPQEQYEALQAARTWYTSAEGQQRYTRRAGLEGTLSRGVRAFGLRRTRYRGRAKTHLQHVAIATAINVDRIVAWLDERPRAQTRTSRCAALAPACLLPLGTSPV